MKFPSIFNFEWYINILDISILNQNYRKNSVVILISIDSRFILVAML